MPKLATLTKAHTISSLCPHPDLSKAIDPQSSKKRDQNSLQQVRILQDNLTFVTSIPSEVADRQMLCSNLYFGRYGSVKKFILSQSFSAKKAVSYQAYVTYNTTLEASLAIVALDGFKIYDRPLKASFGTTKYCSHFIRGSQCPNVECFYLHNIDKSREVSTDDSRNIFKQQNSKAIDNILANLQQVTALVLKSDSQEVEEGFPSIRQILDYLVDKEYIAQWQLEKSFQTARKKKRLVAQTSKLTNRAFSVADPSDKQKQMFQSTQSSFNSTTSTLHNTLGQIKVSSKKTQQKNQHRIPNKAESQPEFKVKQPSQKQNLVGRLQLKLQQQIEKRIIKELLKKSNKECRSRFVKGAFATNQECSRLRGIVQKYLIAHN